jgi:hypothetical protein
MRYVLTAGMVFCAVPSAAVAHDAILSLQAQPALSRRDSTTIMQPMLALSRPEALHTSQIPASSVEKYPASADITAAEDDSSGDDRSGMLLERIAASLLTRKRDAETESLMQIFGLSGADAEDFGPALASRYLMREMFRQKLLDRAGK